MLDTAFPIMQLSSIFQLDTSCLGTTQIFQTPCRLSVRSMWSLIKGKVTLMTSLWHHQDLIKLPSEPQRTWYSCLIGWVALWMSEPIFPYKTSGVSLYKLKQPHLYRDRVPISLDNPQFCNLVNWPFNMIWAESKHNTFACFLGFSFSAFDTECVYTVYTDNWHVNTK